MIELDDSMIFDAFKILDKYEKHPEDLTYSEKKRLKELGIEVE